MSCFRPLQAFRTRAGEVRLGVAPGDCYSLELPCSKCIGCRLDRARMWSVRIMHEAQLFDSNLFLTLTYADEHLPSSLSLEYEDFQGFMKRLRRRVHGVSVGPDGGNPVRFFCCGEYGGKTGRPHFHAILFNVRFKDSVRLVNGTSRSVLCEELWSRGSVVMGDVTARSAAYVAGYTLKKVRGAGAAAHYEDVVNLKTGELSSRRPEFVVMSRRPGIGTWWYERFGQDLFPGDKAVLSEGKKYKVPRFYWKKFQEDGDPKVAEEIAWSRELRAREQVGEGTPERRAVREGIAIARQELFGERGL